MFNKWCCIHGVSSSFMALIGLVLGRYLQNVGTGPARTNFFPFQTLVVLTLARLGKKKNGGPARKKPFSARKIPARPVKSPSWPNQKNTNPAGLKTVRAGSEKSLAGLIMARFVSTYGQYPALCLLTKNLKNQPEKSARAVKSQSIK